MKHMWTVVCRSSAIDIESNLVSLHEVLEQVNVTFPEEAASLDGAILPLDLQVVTSWRRDEWNAPESGRARFRLIAGESSLLEHVYEVALEAHNRSRMRLRLGNLPVPASRPNAIEFVVDGWAHGGWAEAARLPIEIRYGA